jgi:hypothetical protein
MNIIIVSEQAVKIRTISDSKVMSSAAGFYVGTTVSQDGIDAPCERFSNYMTEASATEWLEHAKATGGL